MMRIALFAVLSLVVATSGALAADDKKPKPIADIKKEILGKCGPIPNGLMELDGKTATKDEMEDGKFQVTAFITQEDVYQDCLLKLANTLADRLSESDKGVLDAAIERSQQEKEAVGKAYNDAVDEYNKAHK